MSNGKVGIPEKLPHGEMERDRDSFQSPCVSSLSKNVSTWRAERWSLLVTVITPASTSEPGVS